MKTKIFLSAIMMFMVSALFAQPDEAKIAAALSKSYEYEFSNKYPQALQALNAVYDEKNYFVNLRLGWLNYISGDQQKAVSYYKQAITVAPKSIEARMGIVYPLSALGNWDEVTTVYNEILKLDPANSVVNFRMGLISFNKKEYTKALPYILKVLELYPYDYDSNLLLGKVYMSSGKILDAKFAFYRALQYNPDSKEVQELLKKT